MIITPNIAGKKLPTPIGGVTTSGWGGADVYFPSHSLGDLLVMMVTIGQSYAGGTASGFWTVNAGGNVSSGLYMPRILAGWATASTVAGESVRVSTGTGCTVSGAVISGVNPGTPIGGSQYYVEPYRDGGNFGPGYTYSPAVSMQKTDGTSALVGFAHFQANAGGPSSLTHVTWDTNVATFTVLGSSVTWQRSYGKAGATGAPSLPMFYYPGFNTTYGWSYTTAAVEILA